tara:strand:- start:519 stop:1631 length:1113 start_codon:yes stop_codon:yes gene_type:complete
LNVDTRPNLKFKSDICPACEYWENIKNVDWEGRVNLLLDHIKKLPKFPRRKFDCIIGVSGGKDSTRQALWVRDKLKLRPLLVSIAYPPEQITERGADNISNLIELGFDVHFLSYSPQTWRKLARDSFLRYTNYMKFSEYAIYSVSPILAIKYRIPVIFMGENPAYQLGEMKTMGKIGYDGNNLRYSNTVSGGKIDWLLKAGFKKEKIFQFEYPSENEIKKFKIQSIYLGWFWKDWSIVNNGAYSALEGLKIRTDSLNNTADLYGVFALDEDWITFNQMIKYYKYGFGRTSDYVNEEIRIGRISREDGIKLVEQYDSIFGKKYVESFCDYIQISKKKFWSQVYKNVNKKLFKISPSKKIVPKFKVGFGLIK